MSTRTRREIVAHRANLTYLTKTTGNRMGLTKQLLFEQARDNQLQECADYHGIDVEYMRLDLELVAAQKGIPLGQAVANELEEISEMLAYEHSLAKPDTTSQTRS